MMDWFIWFIWFMAIVEFMLAGAASMIHDDHGRRLPLVIVGDGSTQFPYRAVLDGVWVAPAHIR